MNPILQRVVDDPNLLLAAVFVGLLLLIGVVVGLSSLLLGDDERRMKRRLERVQTPRSQRGGEEAHQVESVRRNKQDSSIAGLDRLIKKLLPNVGQMRMRLARSGWSLKIGDYVLICLALGAGTATAMAFALDMPTFVNALVGVIIGLGLPHFVLGYRIAKRTKKFSTLLPEALDLIVRGIRSGLPATEALRTIGDEIEDPIGIEFRDVTDQMRIGVAMDEAMWATAKRLGIPEFNFLVISLTIQQETGGNLAEILEKLSDMVRRREQMRLKVKAMSSEARASAMIIGSLPFIMCGVLYVVNPEYITTLFTDPRGWVMIGVGLTSLSLGVAVMTKMVKFEI